MRPLSTVVEHSLEFLPAVLTRNTGGTNCSVPGSTDSTVVGYLFSETGASALLVKHLCTLSTRKVYA
jgi:hypothetical protein